MTAPVSSPAAMPQGPNRAPPDRRARAIRAAWAAWLLIPMAFMATCGSIVGGEGKPGAFVVAAISFSLLLLVAFVMGVAAFVHGRRADPPSAARIVGVLAAVAAPVTWVLTATGLVALIAVAGAGGAWGRPLRVRGRQLHPNLRAGADWTRGAQPDARGLDAATRGALEALWLHDAQKEHASVPAFSRISWLLAAVGAPAELLEWSHRAALEEIEHARRCFALAAGYGGRAHTVEAMPDLLLGGLDAREPIALLAKESVLDGCQLEDFNADVARACAEVCEEPVTREVLEIIAREERSHAEFSWALLAWLVDSHAERAVPAIARALTELTGYARPTAVSAEKRAVVDGADAVQMRAHGRLTDAEWGALWTERMEATRARIDGLLTARIASDRARAA